MNIVVQGAGFLHNEGAVAMLLSTIKVLDQAFDSPHICVPVSENDLQPAKTVIQKYRLNNICPFVDYGYGYKRLLLCLALSKISTGFVKTLLYHRGARIYRSADLVIDISGDTLSDHYGKSSSFEQIMTLLPAICLKRKMVIFPQSIGPYVYQRNRLFAKYVFNQCKWVIPREEITKSLLSDLGVKTVSNIIINDVAFWLQQASEERMIAIFRSENIDTHLPIVGISVSQSFVRFRADESLNLKEEYFKAMLDVVEFCVKKLNANVLLIPHVTGPSKDKHDDRIACENLYKLSKHKRNIYQLVGQYKADELKGLISQCQIFIGARMHANIAALSSGIPTLAISYSHKTQGIMRLLGLERWVYHDFADPIANILSELIQKKEEIRSLLETKMGEFQCNRDDLISLVRALTNE